jgi:hypothetical protein
MSRFEAASSNRRFRWAPALGEDIDLYVGLVAIESKQLLRLPSRTASQPEMSRMIALAAR